MVVPTDHGIQKIPLADHLHDRGPADHHKADQRHFNEHGQDEDRRDPGILDPHIWLSPPLVMIQARRILVTLQKADPVHEADYEANYKAL